MFVCMQESMYTYMLSIDLKFYWKKSIDDIILLKVWLFDWNKGVIWDKMTDDTL